MNEAETRAQHIDPALKPTLCLPLRLTVLLVISVCPFLLPSAEPSLR